MCLVQNKLFLLIPSNAVKALSFISSAPSDMKLEACLCFYSEGLSTIQERNDVNALSLEAVNLILMVITMKLADHIKLLRGCNEASRERSAMRSHRLQFCHREHKDTVCHR